MKIDRIGLQGLNMSKGTLHRWKLEPKASKEASSNYFLGRRTRGRIEH